tara:strand:- start:219 stop:632 length:414 start_codon:yes stop_codon:yes gene_type:complete
MNGKDFPEVVKLIRKKDVRYEKGAYFFMRQALDHTLIDLKKSQLAKKSNHVSGGELIGGIRDFALSQYGPMTYTLLTHWGLRKTDDFGNIVFNLVDYGVLGKTENDSPKDFKGGYTFEEAFLHPFLPKSKLGDVEKN